VHSNETEKQQKKFVYVLAATFDEKKIVLVLAATFDEKKFVSVLATTFDEKKFVSVLAATTIGENLTESYPSFSGNTFTDFVMVSKSM
jgi:hypothetical protein